MTKKAIIIVSPLYTNSSGYAPGVLVDAVNWRNFFLSATGGGFYQWEITTLMNPTEAKVLATLRKTPTDYTTIVYSGHGSYSYAASKTMLQLNLSEKMPITKMMGNSGKELFIINCCRNIDYSNFTGIGDPGVSYIKFPSMLTPEQGRRAHNSKLLELRNGIGVIYAASVGQSSWTNRNGSYFCDAILTSARNWATHHKPKSILNMAGALKGAKLFLNKYNIHQTPEIKKSHDHVNFPFAIRYGTELDTLHSQRNFSRWNNDVYI